MIPVKDQNKIKGLFIRALWGYSDMQEKCHGFKPAVDGFLRLARYARAWGDQLYQGLALAEAGYRAARGGDYDAGESRLQEALKLLVQSGRDAEVAVCHKYLAFVHTVQGKFALALEDTENSLAAYLKAGDRQGWAAVVNNKGNILLRLGQADEARRCFAETLETSRASRNIFLESAALSNLAIFHARQDQNEEALKYQLDTMAIRRRTDDLVGLASGLLNLGNIYHMLGRGQEGMDCWKQAEVFSARLGDFSTVASIKFNRAELCDNQGMIGEAFELYRQALDIRLDKNELDALPGTILKWARCGIKCGRLDGERLAPARLLLARLIKMENADEQDKAEAERILKQME
jgi:tetratricopeptide (TPR) repeat protein